MSKQPEALRLAEIQEREWPAPSPREREQAAAELRRLYEANAELLEALRSLYISLDSGIELTPEVMRNAASAIAKATGEQQ